jgi:proteic killer suppression protein
MEITFSNRQLAKLCSSAKEMKAKHGARMAEKLQQRLAELAAAETLDDIPRVPPPRCHELTGNRKGRLAVDLVHPYRLIFFPNHDPVPERKGGGLDWSKVTKIVVEEIIDYH